MADCNECGAVRPSWHGGAHKCLTLGGSYELGHYGYRTITESELEFLRADYAGLR